MGQGRGRNFFKAGAIEYNNIKKKRGIWEQEILKGGRNERAM